MTSEPYNPLARTNLGDSVANALLRGAVHPLTHTAHLVGAGIYAIYYTGSFPPYRAISEVNVDQRFQQPIYVGKAVPKGARKGGLGLDAATGKALGARLRHHASSINEAENLELAHFSYRALNVEDIWIPLGENVLIEKFQPLWNRVIDGFGNKTPGKRRATQQRSPWDVLHPGRRFVARLKLADNPMSAPEIIRRVEDFFSGSLAESDKIIAGEADEEESLS